jgi:hypothetical protein
MSPEQCRATRAWLGWSQQELGQRSARRAFDAMRRAIEAAGIDLIEEDGKAVGIRAT